jgi:magnesium-transporting ATPase (P-type)
MESSSGGRCGRISSDLFIIFVTVAQIIFFTFFHEYIAWYTTAPDGSAVRLSMLTDEYFTWLPFPITASIIVVVTSIVMILYDKTWLRQTAEILFCILGITMTTSLLIIFPFDFSVIPNAKAVDVVPIALRVLLILMAVFYAVCAVVMTLRSRRRRAEQEAG